MNDFFGLYRGIVRVNDDRSSASPLRGRVKVYVPQVYGRAIIDADLPWAEPCFPLGGGRVNKIAYGIIAIPPVNSSVWVMFEQGDSACPVWLGCWYGERDIGDGVTQEMPDEAVAGYPDTVLVMRDGMIIRFTSGSQIEIASVVGGTYVTLSKGGDVNIKTATGDVSVEATTGTVQLVSGQDLTGATPPGLDTRQSVEMSPNQTPPLTRVRAKRFQLQADSVELQAVGKMTLGADDLDAMAVASSGFEKHDAHTVNAETGDY